MIFQNPMENANATPVHRPVMAAEVLRFLAPAPGETFLDLTVGAGGHAAEIAARLGETGLLVGMDLDEDILKHAERRLSGEGLAESRLFHRSYVECAEVLAEAGVEAVDGILLDLGVSSLQLGEAARGFSFSREGPLDMRMDPSGGGPTAADIVNRAGEEELAQIFFEYGQERLSRRIARRIVYERERGRIETTTELATVAKRAYGPRRRRIHPATRIFQALRIEVNGELENLKEVLEMAPEILAPGGRIAVISFHSLEDRIVKEDFRGRAADGVYKLLVKKPLRASQGEVEQNPRSRSAKLRAAQRSVQ